MMEIVGILVGEIALVQLLVHLSLVPEVNSSFASCRLSTQPLVPLVW